MSEVIVSGGSCMWNKRPQSNHKNTNTGSKKKNNGKLLGHFELTHLRHTLHYNHTAHYTQTHTQSVFVLQSVCVCQSVRSPGTGWTSRGVASRPSAQVRATAALWRTETSHRSPPGSPAALWFFDIKHINTFYSEKISPENIKKDCSPWEVKGQGDFQRCPLKGVFGAHGELGCLSIGLHRDDVQGSGIKSLKTEKRNSCLTCWISYKTNTHLLINAHLHSLTDLQDKVQGKKNSLLYLIHTNSHARTSNSTDKHTLIGTWN